MAKDFEMGYLLDFYGEVLTPKQREMLRQYYNDDLSLSEIGENFGITRQGARDAIKHGETALKELEEKLLSAADRRKSLEYKLFQQLRGALAEARPRILFMADMLAQLDYWQSLAETAVRHNWSRPVLHTGQSITIREGRHPVVEGIIGEAAFVPNDLHMDEDRRLLLITGPNMAGKSTVLRQTALICLRRV